MDACMPGGQSSWTLVPDHNRGCKRGSTKTLLTYHYGHSITPCEALDLKAKLMRQPHDEALKTTLLVLPPGFGEYHRPIRFNGCRLAVSYSGCSAPVESNFLAHKRSRRAAGREPVVPANLLPRQYLCHGVKWVAFLGRLASPPLRKRVQGCGSCMSRAQASSRAKARQWRRLRRLMSVLLGRKLDARCWSWASELPPSSAQGVRKQGSSRSQRPQVGS